MVSTFRIFLPVGGSVISTTITAVAKFNSLWKEHDHNNRGDLSNSHRVGPDGSPRARNSGEGSGVGG